MTTGAQCLPHGAPSLGTCPRCGAFVCTACVPAGDEQCGACAARHPLEPLAWEAPGFLPGRFVATWWRVMLRPARTFERMDPGARTWMPFAFVVVCCYLRFLPRQLVGCFEIARELAFLLGDGMPASGVLQAGGTLLAALLGIPLMVAGGRVFLLGALEHGLLWATRVTRHNVTATLRAVSYATAPLALGGLAWGAWVPAELWQLYVRAGALQRVHRVRGVRLIMLTIIVLAMSLLYSLGAFGDALIEGTIEGLEKGLALRR